MLKQLLIITIFFILITSCNQKKNEPVSFQTIDFTIENGWNGEFSVLVDSAKFSKITDHLNGKTTQYIGQMNDSTFAKINVLICEILKTKLDSVIGSPVPDGGVASLIINSRERNINTIAFYHTEILVIDSLIESLGNLNNYKLKTTVDSNWVYNSKSRVIPPPMLETIKFVPPIIKDDAVEK